MHWRLLTTLPVADAAEAFAVADLYRRRWAIEQLFRTLKTKGFDIEALRIGEDAPRASSSMAALVAAVTIQQLVHARDGGAGKAASGPSPTPSTLTTCLSSKPLCQSLEGKTERQKNPHPRGSLAYAAWVCARLGGWTGYYAPDKHFAPAAARRISRPTGLPHPPSSPRSRAATNGPAEAVPRQGRFGGRP